MPKYNNLKPEQRQFLRAQLDKCTTTKEIFDVLTSAFKLEENKPGILTKPMLINGLMDKVLPMTNPETRN